MLLNGADVELAHMSVDDPLVFPRGRYARHLAIAEVFEHVSYRPGWTFTAHRHEWGTYVLIDAMVLDAQKYCFEYSVEENYRVGHTTQVGVRACVPIEIGTPKELLDWLLQRLVKVERHECREFFQVAGAPWDSPHYRPQPKHDYHVRLQRPADPTKPPTGLVPGEWYVFKDLGDDIHGNARWDVMKDYRVPHDHVREPRGFVSMEDAYHFARWCVVQDDLGKPLDGIKNGASDVAQQ